MSNNNDGNHSDYFEELCALAASGQIPEPEFVALRDHMQNCARCTAAYRSYIDLLHSKMPLVDPELAGASGMAMLPAESSSYRDRFLTRARKEGLAVPGEAVPAKPRKKFWDPLLLWTGYAQVAALAVAVLVVTSVSLGFALHESNMRYKTVLTELAVMTTQINSQVRPEPSPAQEVRHQPLLPRPNASVNLPAALPPAIEMDSELVQARQNYQVAYEHANLLEGELTKASSQLNEVTERLSKDLNDSKRELAEVASERDRAIRDRQNALADQSRDKSEPTVQARVTPQVQIQAAAPRPPEFQNVLFVKARENVNRIIGAHIADVYDVDSKGKERASGRVFYTDGKSKSLLFLAHGLSGRTGSKGNVFQVWGVNGKNGTSHSLGTLALDNPSLDVWAIAVNDPAALAGVDSVFVTVEKAGGSEKPSSKQIMYVYLLQISTTP